jgi:hypothetical protein
MVLTWYIDAGLDVLHTGSLSFTRFLMSSQFDSA